MLKIALSGSTGLIGSRIMKLLKNDFIFIPLLQSEVDITDKDSTENSIGSMDFDVFLHLAGYTNVDGAENEKELAHKVNVDGTQNVFNAVMKKKRKFIYISTDFVFDGTNPPYYEDSNPNPLGYYAQTKYEGEKLVKDKAMIVRLSYPYRARFDQKKDFVRNIIKLASQGEALRMVTDSLFTPTFIDDISYGLKYCLKYCFENFSPKIIHLVGANSMSPFDAGKLIAKTFHLDESLIQPTTYNEYSKGKARRSQYSEIKSKNNTFYKMKSFEEGLTEVAKQLRNF